MWKNAFALLVVLGMIVAGCVDEAEEKAPKVEQATQKEEKASGSEAKEEGMGAPVDAPEETSTVEEKKEISKAEEFTQQALATINNIRMTVRLQADNRGDEEAKKVALSEFDYHRQIIDELEPANSKQRDLKKDMKEGLKYIEQFVKDNAGQLSYDLLDEWEKRAKKSAK